MKPDTPYLLSVMIPESGVKVYKFATEKERTALIKQIPSGMSYATNYIQKEETK